MEHDIKIKTVDLPRFHKIYHKSQNRFSYAKAKHYTQRSVLSKKVSLITHLPLL
jgi:hypothetical protein